MSSLAERIQRRMDEQQQHANSSQGQMMAGSRDISFLSGGSELQSVHGEPVGEYPSLEDIYDDDDDGTVNAWQVAVLLIPVLSKALAMIQLGKQILLGLVYAM
ncbi:hypothetical protein BDEG_21842 [Batrachochytrium dendrobatidis JEL423]|uniref:Uncharacterized protein n=1 Tax=Batrachochytrium dendrobatidis (strain JEL423) TaxID=403673 RepID=A0A177WEA3_BATDL|nr:hypothetical protein BDEG_21842 [Batrachochytrium dendrobatidis JEL423]